MPTAMSDSSAPVTSAPVTLNPLRWPDPLRWLVLGARDMMAAPGVALEAEAVEQISATYAFQANLLALRRADEMAGALLDVRA